MSKLEIHQIAVLNDNYVYLAHDAETGATAVVDPAVGGPVLDALAARLEINAYFEYPSSC